MKSFDRNPSLALIQKITRASAGEDLCAIEHPDLRQLVSTQPGAVKENFIVGRRYKYINYLSSGPMQIVTLMSLTNEDERLSQYIRPDNAWGWGTAVLSVLSTQPHNGQHVQYADLRLNWLAGGGDPTVEPNVNPPYDPVMLSAIAETWLPWGIEAKSTSEYGESQLLAVPIAHMVHLQDATLTAISKKL